MSPPAVAHLDHDHATLVKVVFGSVHAGDAANVIPTHGVLKASIRTPSLAVWDVLADVFERELRAIVAGSGAEVELDYTHGVPPVVNDPRRHRHRRRGGCRRVRCRMRRGGRSRAGAATTSPGSPARYPAPTFDSACATRTVRRSTCTPGTSTSTSDAIAIGVQLLAATVERFFAGPRRGVSDRHLGLRLRIAGVTGVDGHHDRSHRRRRPTSPSPTSTATGAGGTTGRCTFAATGTTTASRSPRGSWCRWAWSRPTHESCNGVIVRVTAEELAMLDWRERDYERTDVSDLIRRRRRPDQPSG